MPAGRRRIYKRPSHDGRAVPACQKSILTRFRGYPIPPEYAAQGRDTPGFAPVWRGLMSFSDAHVAGKTVLNYPVGVFLTVRNGPPSVTGGPFSLTVFLPVFSAVVAPVCAAGTFAPAPHVVADHKDGVQDDEKDGAAPPCTTASAATEIRARALQDTAFPSARCRLPPQGSACRIRVRCRTE